MVVKQRTLNELRQEKEFGYKQPVVKNSKPNVDSQHIVDLVMKFPNDADLGKQVRNYLIGLGIYGK